MWKQKQRNHAVWLILKGCFCQFCPRVHPHLFHHTLNLMSSQLFQSVKCFSVWNQSNKKTVNLFFFHLFWNPANCFADATGEHLSFLHWATLNNFFVSQFSSLKAQFDFLQMQSDFSRFTQSEMEQIEAQCRHHSVTMARMAHLDSNNCPTKTWKTLLAALAQHCLQHCWELTSEPSPTANKRLAQPFWNTKSRLWDMPCLTESSLPEFLEMAWAVVGLRTRQPLHTVQQCIFSRLSRHQTNTIKKKSHKSEGFSWRSSRVEGGKRASARR